MESQEKVDAAPSALRCSSLHDLREWMDDQWWMQLAYAIVIAFFIGSMFCEPSFNGMISCQ